MSSFFCLSLSNYTAYDPVSQINIILICAHHVGARRSWEDTLTIPCVPGAIHCPTWLVSAPTLAQPEDHPCSTIFIPDRVTSWHLHYQPDHTWPHILYRPYIWQPGTNGNGRKDHRLQKPAHLHSPVERDAAGMTLSQFHLYQVLFAVLVGRGAPTLRQPNDHPCSVILIPALLGHGFFIDHTSGNLERTATEGGTTTYRSQRTFILRWDTTQLG